MPWIVFAIIIFLILKVPKWIANNRYNASKNQPNIGKMLNDKYENNLSNTQIKNNIANGKYNKKG